MTAIDDRPADARLRVLMATPRFLPSQGGVETHVNEVSRRLAAAGVDVSIVAADATRSLPRHSDADSVHVEHVPAWPAGRDYLFAPALDRVIGTGAWDVVHVQSYHTLVAPMSMLAAWRHGIPYVVTFHGGGHSSTLRHRLRGSQLRLLRPLLTRAARLVAVARFEIERYGGLLGLPREKFALVPNGCDLPEPPARTAPSGGPLIVSAGRLERYKGHQDAIAALPQLLRLVPDARLRIVGSGPYEDQLRALAVRLGVESRVEIRGIPPRDRSAMASTLASASLVVLFSEFETHPVAVLEALALGRPTLVADGTGLGEIAAQGLSRAVRLGSPPELTARAMSEELRSPTPSRAPDLPTWDDCADGLRRVYEHVRREATCGC